MINLKSCQRLLWNPKTLRWSVRACPPLIHGDDCCFSWFSPQNTVRRTKMNQEALCPYDLNRTFKASNSIYKMIKQNIQTCNAHFKTKGRWGRRSLILDADLNGMSLEVLSFLTLTAPSLPHNAFGHSSFTHF